MSCCRSLDLLSPAVCLNGWEEAGSVEIDAGIEIYLIECIHDFSMLLRDMDVAESFSCHGVVLADEIHRLKQKSFSPLDECLGKFIPGQFLHPGESGLLSRRKIFCKANTFWAFFSQMGPS